MALQGLHGGLPKFGPDSGELIIRAPKKWTPNVTKKPGLTRRRSRSDRDSGGLASDRLQVVAEDKIIAGTCWDNVLKIIWQTRFLMNSCMATQMGAIRLLAFFLLFCLMYPGTTQRQFYT